MMAGGKPSRSGAAARPRLPEVDALRGFALLGIVVVNAGQIAGSWAWRMPYDLDASPLAGAIRFLVTAVFATKFYVLFSFLFGYSFTLQIESARRAGAQFQPGYLRRLAGLLAFGIAHAVLLYVGDILTTYAILGLVLLAVRDLRPGAASGWAAVILTAMGGLLVVLGLLMLVAPPVGPDAGAQQTVPAEQLVAQYRGSPGDVVAANLTVLPRALSSAATFQAPSALAMFLLGLAAGKRGLLTHWHPGTATLWRMVALGLLVGIPGAVLYAASTHLALSTPWVVVALGVDVVTAPLLSAAYASVLLLAMRARFGRHLRSALAPAGRLALTNYLSQSLVLMLVFTGYGLALYDRLGAATVLGIGVLVYFFQLAASAAWVRYLRYGPAEWALRTVTYAGFPPMRR